MKLKHLLCAYVILQGSTCGVMAQTTVDSIPTKKCYSYSFSNTKSNKFGKKEFEDSPGNSVNSIAKSKSHVFLTDPIHSNIKRIDINDGSLKCSQILTGAGSLVDILASDSLIYVMTNGGVVFILNHTLKMIDKIRLYDNSDSRQLIMNNGKVYGFSPSSDVSQSKTTYEFTIQAKRVDSNHEIVNFVTPKGYDAYSGFINGYTINSENSCLRIGDKIRCFNNLTYLYNDYETTRSVYVSERSVTYFTFSDNQLEICDYTWDN